MRQPQIGGTSSSRENVATQRIHRAALRRVRVGAAERTVGAERLGETRAGGLLRAGDAAGQASCCQREGRRVQHAVVADARRVVDARALEERRARAGRSGVRGCGMGSPMSQTHRRDADATAPTSDYVFFRDVL